MTAFLANSLLPDLSFVMDDDDPRQGWLSRSGLRAAAAVMREILSDHGDDVAVCEQDAEQALALAAAARAGLSSDDHIASIGLLAYANAWLRACREAGINEDALGEAVVAEIDRQVLPFLEGRRDLPPRR